MEALMAPKPQSNHRKKSLRGSKTIINVDYFRKYLYFIFGSLLNRHLRVETQYTQNWSNVCFHSPASMLWTKKWFMTSLERRLLFRSVIHWSLKLCLFVLQSFKNSRLFIFFFSLQAALSTDRNFFDFFHLSPLKVSFPVVLL